MRVKVYGNIAVITDGGQNTGTWQGQPLEADEWITDVYKRENDKWLCVFEGYNANIPHDMRSASKSISSAIVGIAKDKYLFKNVDQSVFFSLKNIRDTKTL